MKRRYYILEIPDAERGTRVGVGWISIGIPRPEIRLQPEKASSDSVRTSITCS